MKLRITYLLLVYPIEGVKCVLYGVSGTQIIPARGLGTPGEKFVSRDAAG